jgi:Iap family predicted aminopeptidase
MMLAVRACFVLILIIVQFAAAAQDSLLDSTINKQSLNQLISFIAADSMYGRFTGTEGNAKAAAFIADQLEKAGASPVAGNDGYYMPFTVFPVHDFFNVQNTKAYNIIAALPGKSKPDELIIFSAHYDHIGTKSTYNLKGQNSIDARDTIYNGANDNASGVSAMIALARYYGQLKNNERTILFIAFSGEELGLMGSRAFATHINPHNIVAMLNLEMLGGHAWGSYGKPFITGHKFSNLYTILNNELSTLDRKKYGKNFFGIDRESLFHRSDNYPFAEMGVPAHTIMAGSTLDRRYHGMEDEVETLNIKKMAEVVRAIALAARPLIDGSVTPSRINPRQLQ